MEKRDTDSFWESHFFSLLGLCNLIRLILISLFKKIKTGIATEMHVSTKTKVIRLKKFEKQYAKCVNLQDEYVE